MMGSNYRTLSITAERLSKRFRGLQVAGYYAPAANFDPYSSEADFAIDSIRASGARLCFLALGAPRQELFPQRAASIGSTEPDCSASAPRSISLPVPKPARPPLHRRPEI